MKIGKRGNQTLDSIQKYSNLIKAIPIEKQSTGLSDKGKSRRESLLGKSFKEIFPEEDIVISRKDILNEHDCRKKIVMTLVWGYPTGGRGHHIENVLSNLSDLCKVLCAKQKKDLSREKLASLIAVLENVKGLGESTWSKLLYFFKIQVEGRRCQIFDKNIKDALNSPQFIEQYEFNEERGISWKQDAKKKDKEKNGKYFFYFQFMDLLSALSDKIGFDSDDEYQLEKLENFLFHYSLNFKF